jgi:hypothetical protein
MTRSLVEKRSAAVSPRWPGFVRSRHPSRGRRTSPSGSIPARITDRRRGNFRTLPCRDELWGTGSGDHLDFQLRLALRRASAHLAVPCVNNVPRRVSAGSAPRARIATLLRSPCLAELLARCLEDNAVRSWQSHCLSRVVLARRLAFLPYNAGRCLRESCGSPRCVPSSTREATSQNLDPRLSRVPRCIRNSPGHYVP